MIEILTKSRTPAAPSAAARSAWQSPTSGSTRRCGLRRWLRCPKHQSAVSASHAQFGLPANLSSCTRPLAPRSLATSSALLTHSSVPQPGTALAAAGCCSSQSRCTAVFRDAPSSTPLLPSSDAAASGGVTSSGRGAGSSLCAAPSPSCAWSVAPSHSSSAAVSSAVSGSS